MDTIPSELPYHLSEDDIKGDPRVPGSGMTRPINVTRFLFREFCAIKYPQGADGAERRLIGKIDMKLDDACRKPEQEFVELSEDQFKFFCDIVKGAKVRPAIAIWWMTLVDFVESTELAKQIAKETLRDKK